MKKITLLLAITVLTFNAFASDTTLLTVQIGAGAKIAAITLKDQVTGNAITGVISNVTVQNNNPELATVIPNPPNPTIIRATAIATGIGTAVVSCQATYTDPGDGLQKTETKSIVIKYTVIGAPHGVKLALTFN